ncbi:MAG: hypothetical protein SWY16_11705 [Cyanobacteriota bacterium]|nr:hypothetical protein [Cyanobacteriota bacterium]
MASPDRVKQYLAYWFQLGKKLWVRNGEQSVCPRSVIRGDSYSPEFEACWQLICSPESGDCYLEGMPQTIGQLLESEWELAPCARCELLVPMRERGLPTPECPCSDIPTWPNTELPQPRLPISTRSHLTDIRSRLLSRKGQTQSEDLANGDRRSGQY